MTATEHPVERLIQERHRLVDEVEALRNKIAGLDFAISLLSERSVPAFTYHAKTRVSETITCLLRDSGASGLKPMAVVDLAARNGITLKRGSVYALLHRMERVGKFVH